MLSFAQVLALSNQKGIENITVHSISNDHSYKVVKFKQAFNKAMKAYNEAREAIVKEVGIEDEKKFNEDYSALKKIKERTKEQEKEYKEMVAKEEKLNGMTSSLLKEEAKLEGVKTLPYDVWKALQDENHDDKKDMLTGQVAVISEIGPEGVKFTAEDVETMLEDILWTMPEEKDEK